MEYASKAVKALHGSCMRIVFWSLAAVVMAALFVSAVMEPLK